MHAMKKLANRLRNDTRGNAIMITALAIPTLIGGAGFAVDTAQWYLWKRELQHSVDQAAYAGAWALTEENSKGNYKVRARQEYYGNLKVTTEFATRPTITIANYAGGTDNSVIVTASATKSLPFTNFLTGQSATIGVSAQASFAEGGTFNACIVSTTKTGTGTTISGSAFIDASCGFAALSCDEDAIVVDGSAEVITDSLASCGTIGIDGTVTNGESGEGELTGEELVTEGVEGLYDRYEDLVPPDDPTPQDDDCTGNGKNAQAALQPGTYSELVVKCTTTLATGVYVIDGGTLDLTANYNVTGLGVMFVLKNGAIIKLGGSGNSNKLNLTPMTASQLLALGYDEDLEGMLVFEYRDNNPSKSHIFNGNSNSLIEGIIYLPDSNLQVNGTADVASQCLKITAFTITVSGDANITTLCPTDESTETGGGTAKVRMVA